MSSPRRARVLAFLCSLALALLGAELALRWWLPELATRPFLDSHLGWAHEEYLALDPDAYRPPDGRTRMLVLGDSYLASSYRLEGRDVRFPALLAEALPDDLETLTLSTSGWGTDQQLLAFLEKGRAWRPDYVVLAFCANNDLGDILSVTHGRGSRKPWFRLEPDGALVLHDAAGAPIELASLASLGHSGHARVRSHLLDLLRLRLAVPAGPPTSGEVDPRYLLFDGMERPETTDVYRLEPALDWSPQLAVSSVSAYLAEDFELNAYQWRLFEAVLGNLRDRTAEAGAELVVLLLPMVFRPRDLRFSTASELEHRFETPDGPITFRMAEPGRRLAAITARLGVRYLDPSAPFFERIGAQGLEEQVWPDAGNRHFGPLGHRLLAKILEGYVRDELGVGAGAAAR